MSSWADNHPGGARSDRSRSPRREGGHGGDSRRDWDLYGRDRESGGWERDRRGRSRSPGYDDGRKRRRSMSPYDRERYESRPRYDDHDPYRGYDRSPHRLREHRHSASRQFRQAPPDPHTFDAPASLKQYAEWFRFYYPQQAIDEDQADKLAEQMAGDGTRPRNGIKARWERYKKDFLQKQLQILFDFHRKSPWFAERYDPELLSLRSRVRKVGWRGRINQFVTDLENGTFDTSNTGEPEASEATKDVPDVPADGADVADTSVRNDDEFGMGPDGEDEAQGNAGETKADGNPPPRESRNEFSVLPEGNQVMIRTIPPDIGRVKLENVLRDMSGFVYLALGDPMQKRNYYRAGWIKFDIATDVQGHIATLSERKIEGFKLHVTHNSEAFTGKVRYTPEGASKPDRIEKDLANAKKLAALLEEEYESVRTFKQRPDGKDGEGEAINSDDKASKEATNGGPPADVLAIDAMAEDEPPSEPGSAAIERRVANLTAEFPEPQDDETAKTLELKKSSMALDFYLAYLRHAFHTCYYCAAVCDHQEELQRKCVKHVRRPLSVASKVEDEKDAQVKEEGMDDLYGIKEEEGSEKKRKDFKSKQKDELRRSDERWAEAFDAKISLLVNKDTIDVRDYGGRRYEDAVAKAVEPHVRQEDEGKFRCKACNKLFKATSFVEKHICNKHPELVKQLDELPYFNNFALDPQRISPLSQYPPQPGNGALIPPQAFGLQKVPQPAIDLARNGMAMGMGIGAPPVTFYPMPGQIPPHFANGANPYLAYYPQAMPAQPMPMRGLRDEAALSSNGGQSLGDRIGGYMPGAEGPSAGLGHGIEGLPAKPVLAMDAALSAGPGNGRRNGAGRVMPPPPPDAKEDPRAAAGRKVSYYDMDLVAEGDVELSY